MESYFKKFVAKDGRMKIKRKDLPKCPYCGSDAFLTHDLIDPVMISKVDFLTDEVKQACIRYYENSGAEKMDMGYSCGCKAFADGKEHPEEMAIGFKTRRAAIVWWLRKVDAIYAERERKENGK